MPDNTEQRLTLPQADQARTDSAIIEDELEAIHARPAPSSMHRYSNRGRFDFTVAECDMVDGNSGIPSFEGDLGSIRRWLRLWWAFLFVHFG